MKKKWIREIWDNLPAWYLLWNAVVISSGFISAVPIPRRDLIVTSIFPYALFLLFYRGRIYSNPGIGRVKKNLTFLVLSGSTAFILLLTVFISFPIRIGETPADHLANYKIVLEYGVILLELVMGVHCFVHRRGKDCLLFVIPAIIYGMIVESGGVAAGYFAEDHYSLYLPFLSAPLVTMMAWSFICYISVFVSRGILSSFTRLKRSRYLLPALGVALTSVFMDLQMDPFAKEMKMWTWNPIFENGGSMMVFGVPMVNFIAWFGAVFSFALAYFFTLRRYPNASQLNRAIRMTLFIPFMLMMAGFIIYSVTAITEGFNGPSWTLLKRLL